MELTHKLLLANGWEQDEESGNELCFCHEVKNDQNQFWYVNIKILCIEGFCTWLIANEVAYGEGFTTTEELQAIFKALFKFDLKFEDK